MACSSAISCHDHAGLTEGPLVDQVMKVSVEEHVGCACRSVWHPAPRIRINARQPEPRRTRP
jgi:hypothetical protein